MKFLREKDDRVYSLASMQARIFEKSAIKDFPSYFFIQSFMNSKDAKMLDDFSYFCSGSSETEIYYNTLKNQKEQRYGNRYPSEVMHWMGFFYRYAAYLTGISSKKLFKLILPKYLNQVYPLYHGLDIAKAVERVFDDIHYQKETPQQKFLRIYNVAK